VLRGTSKDYTKAGDVYAFGILQVELLASVSLLTSHHADTSMVVTTTVVTPLVVTQQFELHSRCKPWDCLNTNMSSDFMCKKAIIEEHK
jgi:hypothetical protein